MLNMKDGYTRYHDKVFIWYLLNTNYLFDIRILFIHDWLAIQVI